MPLLPDAALWRSRFPIFRQKIYLNSCSQGALSLDVRAAYEAYLHDWETQGSPWEYWVERYEAVRAAVAQLLNADPGEIALLTSVSAAVSALASSLDYSGSRNKIVVDDFAFPTVAQIWHAQERRGARVVHVPVSGHTIPLESFARVVDEQTLLVSLSHVHFCTGAKQDIEAITTLAHRWGAMVLLDAYQSLGTTPVDVRRLPVDFLVSGTLKYLLASPGLAFLYVRHDRIPALIPTVTGWFAQEDIFAMDIYRNVPASTARRFEAGTPPVPSLYAALAGLDIIQRIGPAAIESHIAELTSHLITGALCQGYRIVTPLCPERHGALITLRSHDVATLVTRLAGHNLIVSSRDQNLRISPHFYNTHDDIEQLLTALEANRKLLI
ncbi:MAG: aminotransferase class V-fold PLP-dependent enzyme [Nitrospinota bacterium]|nr:MAG: aminotransferase class V-fold PLP-dependent enzyme [Nitrospinota bacterium]